MVGASQALIPVANRSAAKTRMRACWFGMEAITSTLSKSDGSRPRKSKMFSSCVGCRWWDPSRGREESGRPRGGSCRRYANNRWPVARAPIARLRTECAAARHPLKCRRQSPGGGEALLGRPAATTLRICDTPAALSRFT